MLRHNRELRTLFMAQVVSYAGDWFAYVALLGLVDDLTDSSLLVALVFVAQVIPAFLLAPVAGAVADRFDRRKIIVTASAGQTVAALSLLAVGPGRVWLAFVAVAAVAALAAFVPPASQAAVPNLARDDEELKKAATLLGSTWGAMLAIGAALGGVFASVFGRDAAFVADAVSFVVAGVLVFTIRRPMQERTRPAGTRRMKPLADMHEALSYARKDHALGALMFSKATYGIGAGLVGILAILVTSGFDGGDAATGLLIGARGVGAALGPLVAARLIGPSVSRLLRLCGVAGMTFGGCYLVVSVAPTLAVAALFVFLAHFGGGSQWTLSTFGLQLRAPDAVRGRVLAGDMAFVTLVLSGSTAAAGAMSQQVGARPTIAAFSVLALAAGSAYLLVTRGLRRRLAEEEAGGATVVVRAAT
jgi:MFS family permease